MNQTDIKLAMMYGADPSKLIQDEAVQDAYSPFDAIAGGVAGTMTAPAATVARFLAETALDPVYEAAINGMQSSDYLPAMYIGKRGARRLGMDIAGSDLHGQFSGLWDRQPRLEIDDSGMKFKQLNEGDILRASDAFSELPPYNFDKMRVSGKNLGSNSGVYRGVNEYTGNELLDINPMRNKEQKPIALHELQHAIQQREGFASGGSPEQFRIDHTNAMNERQLAVDNANDLHSRYMAVRRGEKKGVDGFMSESDWGETLAFADNWVKEAREAEKTTDPFSMYKRLSGEAEARDTAARMNLSPEERMRTQPLSGYRAVNGELQPMFEENPIALDDLISRFDGGESMSLPMDEASRVGFDENNNYVSFNDGRTRITLDNKNNPELATLWKIQEVNNKKHWRKVGALKTDTITKKINGNISDYLKVNHVEIEKDYRGFGFGEKLYKNLLDNSSDSVDGILSYTPSRSNKREVPSLYRKLEARRYNDGDIEIIHKNK